MSPLIALLVVSLGAPDRTIELSPSVDFRVSGGSEWDTNAQRAVSDTSSTVFADEVVGDALMRVLVGTKGDLQITPADSVSVDYSLGAKRFFVEDSEDLVVHDLAGSSYHWLLDELAVGFWGRGRISRLRSGLRDYDLLFGGANLTLVLGDFSLSGRGRATDFNFLPEERLSYSGPGVGTELGWRGLSPLSLSLFFDFDWRPYHTNALVEAFNPDGTPLLTDQGGAQIYTFCDGSDDVPTDQCESIKRRDTMASTGLRAAYRGDFILGGEATARLQRSSSKFENLDRYQLTAFGTVPLPWHFALSFLGSLQFNRGVSITRSQLLAEDDENQNRLEVQLSYALSEPMDLEVRYALYANEFASNSASFLRQTFYLGLSWGYSAELE